MRISRFQFSLLVLSLLAITVTTPAFSQGITTGTVTGTVTDPSGAVVPGAQVELTNVATGVKLDEKSAGDGTFKFFLVPIGTYRALITASGFANEEVNNVQVVSGASTNLVEVKLHVASAQAQEVEVNGSAAALLQTTDSQVTTTFDTKTMANLPLNNGFDTVAELIPGVVGVGDDNFSNANGDDYSVNGQSSRYNNYEIDGQTNNDNTVGGTLVFFGNQDAIEQIQVITNQYSAQYGRNAGAVVNYITKSGTNSFHGTASDLYQSEFLSSFANEQKNPLFGFCPPGVSPTTGCEAPELPRYVENRAGGTVGGPVLRDKLFFFFGTYWDRIRPGASPSESFPALTPVPGPAGLGAIAATFSGDPGAAAITDFGPYSITAGNPQPISVPASLCPAADTYAGGACLENVTDASGNSAAIQVAGVERTIASPSNDQEELARLDWQPTEKDRLFLRFYYQNQLFLGVAGSDGIAAGDWIEEPSSTYDIGADWTHTFTSNFIDQLRYSFQDSKVLFQGGAFPDCVISNFGACPAQVNFNGGLEDSNFAGDADFPQGNTVKVTQVQNNATWTHGRQTLLFGGEFDYQNSPDTGIFYYNGYPIYGTLSNLMGAPSAGLINEYGLPPDTSAESYLANGNLVVPFTEPDVAAYFQDDWKVLPTLTLHVGMRWEFFSDVIDKLHSETVARESNPSTAFWNPALPLSVRTVPYVPQIYTNFEPRIGFAWNPDFDRKLVISSGYAINANPVYYNLDLLVSDGAPVTNDGAFLCFTNACLPSNGSVLDADFRALNLPSLPTGGDPGQDIVDTFPTNFRTPYVQTWTLGIQHQIGGAAVGEIRYVGSKTTDDFQSVDANPFLLPVADAFPNDVSASSLCSDPTADGYGRPNCNYGDLIETTNGGWANYNAVELNLTTQNYHGLTSTVSYTFSKTMDNATDGFRSNGAGGSTLAFSQNPLDTSAGERGLGGNDFPNTLGIGFTYDLPKLVKGESFLARSINGFLLSGVYRYRSGQVYTPYQPIYIDGITGDTSFCDAAFNANVIGVDTCRLVVSNPKAPINTLAYLNPYVNGSTPYSPVPGTPEFVVYGSDGFDSSGNYIQGTPVDPTTTHWIVNNQAYALMVNNPYPGWSRSLLRGQPYSDLDATITKTFPITERVNLQLSMAAYNALNQMFRGVGDAFIGATNFTSNQENGSGTVPGSTSGNRFVILGGKVIF